MSVNLTQPRGNPGFLISVLGVIAITLGMFLVFALPLSKKTALKVENKQVLVSAFPYSTKMSVDDIEVDKIRLIDMDKEGIRIGIRTNGVGLPGLQIGWYSGSKGKMMLYLTDRKSVLEIPTKRGYTIYFSTKYGDEIIEMIRTATAE